MKRNRDSEYDEIGAGLPDEWAETGRHPHLPGGTFGTFEVEWGVCIFDRDDPERYILGDAVEVGEFE